MVHHPGQVLRQAGLNDKEVRAAQVRIVATMNPASVGGNRAHLPHSLQSRFIVIKLTDYKPEELEGLEALLSDTYFCNFSVFQSMPDSWAIKQLFPVMPIHRLTEAQMHIAPFQHPFR